MIQVARVAVLVGLAAATVVAAVDGRIRVTPLVTGDEVSASFAAGPIFSEGAREVMQSGLLLTFTFTVDLCRPVSWWFDPTLASTTVAASVKYDNLTGVYQVSKLSDGHVVWSDRSHDEAQVRTWMTTFDRVPLAARAPLEPNVEYYVRVRLRTAPKRSFPLWPWGGSDAEGRAAFTFLR